MLDLTPRPGDLEPIEKASRDELAALQLERLRWSLRHAYENVPFYRDAFDAAGVHPEECRALEDPSRFPFTAKDDLRENHPFGMLAVPREQVARIHASSGTTGIPTVVAYTKADVETWADVCARSIRAAGGRPGDVVHVAYGYGLFTGGLGAHYGAERLGCTVVDRRARLHIADEGGDAPKRRHADLARRESLPDADRGADPADARAVGALPARLDAARPARRACAWRRDPTRPRPRRARGRNRRWRDWCARTSESAWRSTSSSPMCSSARSVLDLRAP